jgi:hypothetical protein
MSSLYSNLLLLIYIVFYYCLEFSHLFINIDLVISFVSLFSIRLLQVIFLDLFYVLYFTANLLFYKKYGYTFFFLKRQLQNIGWLVLIFNTLKIFFFILYHLDLTTFYTYVVWKKRLDLIQNVLKIEFKATWDLLLNTLAYICFFKFELLLLLLVIEICLRCL